MDSKTISNDIDAGFPWKFHGEHGGQLVHAQPGVSPGFADQASRACWTLRMLGGVAGFLAFVAEAGTSIHWLCGSEG